MIWRWRISRLLAALLLVGFLVVVPGVVVSLLGPPLPSPNQLATAWRQRRVPSIIVIRTGAFVFMMLWAWFAATAIGELRHVLRCRREGVVLERLSPGPSRWVRALVRVVVISAVSASALASSANPLLRSGAAPTLQVASMHDAQVQSPVRSTHTGELDGDAGVVSTGRDTPYSLAAMLGRADLRDAIIELNNGRETPDGGRWSGGVFPEGMSVVLPSVDAGASASAGSSVVPAAPQSSASGGATSNLVAFASGLGTALMLSAGALTVLEARRRRQWRASAIGARLALPTPAEVSTEAVLRVLDAPERIARLDVAVRAASGAIAAQGAVVGAVVLGDHGELTLFLTSNATPDGELWSVDPHRCTWSLRPDVDVIQLAAAARGVAQPCPAMVHLGSSPGLGEVFVDLEAAGTLVVDSTHSRPIVRAIASTLAVSPFIESARVFVHGLGDEWLSSHVCEAMDSPDSAVEAARMALGSTPSLARQSSTFALRARGRGGELWEPAIVVAAGESFDETTIECIRSVGRCAGLAVVCDARPDAGPSFDDAWVLQEADETHILMPFGLALHPVGVTEEEIDQLRRLLDSAEVPPEVHAPVVPIESALHPPFEPVEFVERDWALLVRVLGTAEVVSSEGLPAQFERSKSLELVVWLSQHRERPTRTAARTALWDLDVRDATFANVVSDARRALARAATPIDDAEWIPRTLTEELSLDLGVVTDVELLADRVSAARGLRPADAIEVLRPGVELLAGLPFAGTCYLWTDAEGLTSAHVLLATGAAIELAQHYLALGDIDGVFWATGQGLRVLAGHEELISLRMRAHARRGDLAGVRSEWDSYERALASDPWAAAEPAPKLVALRRELLCGERATA